MGLLKWSNRCLLRLWGCCGVAPGWRYQMIEKYGPELSERLLKGQLPNGCTVNCNIADHVQRHIYFWGAYEPVEAYVFSRMVKQGFTVIDAGANVGQYTMLASTAVKATGAIHAFEPITANYDRLTANVVANQLKNVTLNRSALWHEAAELDFGHVPETIGENHGTYGVGRGSQGEKLRVRAERLDDYVQTKSLQRCDVIKMDIEGSEWAALQGAAGTLARFRPTILLEVNRDASRSAGGSIEDLLALLADNGYRLWEVGVGEAKPLGDVSQIGHTNAVACPGDLPDELRSIPPLKEIFRWARNRSVLP